MSVATIYNQMENIHTSLVEKYIFGDGSSLVDGIDRGFALADEFVSVSGERSFEIAVLFILILYILWVGRSFSNMDSSEIRISNPFGELNDSRGMVRTMRVGDIILDWGLVVALVALLITRVVDVSQTFSPFGVEFARRIVAYGMGRWLFVVGGGFLVSMAWGVLILNFMGYILHCDWIKSDIMRIKSRLLMMTVVWLLPFVLMSTLEVSGFTMTYFAIFVAILFIVIYLFRTFLLFRSQKISILHWILYLCSVELIPITLVWVFFVRN